ncbi:MAG: septum formation initiator family protein [Candidatus Magasanikiibacteriota bacterium]
MTTRHEQSLVRRFFASRMFLVVAFVIAILVALGYARAYYQDYKINQEIEALQAQVKSLEHKKLESMEILKYVTSPEFVEEKARTELNMKKPGENVVVINGLVESNKTKESNPVENNDLNNQTKWWYYFIHQEPNMP